MSSYGESGIRDFFKANETNILEFGFLDSDISGQVTLTISEDSISQGRNFLSSPFLSSGSVKVTVPRTADYRLKFAPNSAATVKLLDEENTVVASCDEPTTGVITLNASLQADKVYDLFVDQRESEYGLSYNVAIEEAVSSVAEGDNTVTIPAGKTVRLLWSAPRSGNFDIYTTGNNDTVGAIYSYTGEKLAENDDSNGDRNFRLTQYVTAYEKYYIDVRYYSNYLSGDVNLHIGEKELKLGANTIDLPSQTMKEIKYVIPEDGTYSFYTTGDDYTIAKSIRANVNSPYQLSVIDVYTGGEGHNFRYTYTFSKGTTVNMQICYNDAQNSALMGRWCEGSGQINLVIEKTNWTWNMNGDVLRKNTEFCGILIAYIICCRAYLLPYLGHCGGHKCAEERCGNSDSFKEIVKHSGKSRLVRLVLCKHPRSSLVDILVCTGNYLEYLRKGKVEGCVVHTPVNSFSQ